MLDVLLSRRTGRGVLRLVRHRAKDGHVLFATGFAQSNSVHEPLFFEEFLPALHNFSERARTARKETIYG